MEAFGIDEQLKNLAEQMKRHECIANAVSMVILNRQAAIDELSPYENAKIDFILLPLHEVLEQLRERGM